MQGFVKLADVAPPGSARIKDEPRTIVWREPFDGAPAVFKLYRRRGVGTLLRAPCRARREYDALARLAAAAVPCTVPSAWSRGRSPAHGRWELLITCELPDVVSLRVWLETGAGTAAALPLEPLFATLGAMHGAGVFHGALWSSNILTDGRGFFVSDMARSVLLRRGLRGGALAQAELLDFCYSLTNLGVPPERLPLALAGVVPVAETRFRARLADYRPGKRVRQSARARALLQRLLGGGSAAVG